MKSPEPACPAGPETSAARATPRDSNFGGVRFRLRRAMGKPLTRPVLSMAGVVLVVAASIGLATGGGAVEAGAAQPMSTPGGAGEVPLTGSAVGLPAGAQVTSATSSTATVTADVSLKPRDPAALEAFVHAVSTPGSTQYGHYLARGQFGPEFGPTPATVTSTRAWLASSGLRVGATSSDGLLIPVSGTASQIESAFGVPLENTRLAGGRMARFGTAEPRVPAALADSVGGVLGLSTVTEAHPQLVAGQALAGGGSAGGTSTAGSTSAGSAGPHAAAVAHVGPTACSAASGAAGANGWTADQLASAYGFDTLYGQGRVGAGQTVGIYELEPFTPSDIQAFETCYGINVPVSTVPVDGGAGTVPQSGEAALDIEMVAGLAPSSSIIVYDGPNDSGSGPGSGPYDTYARMVDDDTAKVLTSSWGECEGASGISLAEQQLEATLFTQAAAQDQTVFAASGDSGSTDCYDLSGGVTDKTLSVDDPADQPYVTGVGGTSLTSISTPSPTESVWNDGPNGGAGGGGVSADFVAPSWQRIPEAQNSFTSDTCGGPSPGTGTQQCREVPDVSASADASHGAMIYVGGEWRPYGGTSTAAPVWAALTTVIKQGCATPAGFLNPTLYAAGAGGSPPFNDITNGNNDLFASTPPDYPATSGYDLASGWGTPKAAALLGTLTGSPAGCPAVTWLSANSGPATGGSTVVIVGDGFGSTTPTVHFGGAAAAVLSSTPTSVTVRTPDVTYGQQTGVTVTVSAGPAAGTSATVPAGEYTFVSPQITGIVPGKGPTSGGGTVIVNGSDFSGATSVRFGSSGASFRVTSDTSLVAQVPPGPAGGATVEVVVQSPDGTSPSVASDRYLYALPGYWLVASDGGIFALGHAGFYGSAGGTALNEPVVGMAAAPDDSGNWLVASDGGVFSYGNAGFYGSTGALRLNKPVVGMAATPDGGGYWLVASDGGIFAFGDAGFYGSTGTLRLNKPVVGMAATPDGGGYWLVASDGGIFAFGDAGFYGSTGALRLNKPVVGMAAVPDGGGYWLVASDGGIFALGDAGFYGSTGALRLNKPVVGMASSLSGNGYWLVASDGGIFALGDAGFYGSAGSLPLTRPVVGMAGT
ncbi:MAG: protease pro-enzyme activation domain-containing protein [Acidimicrobiales bacterium]